MKKLQQNFKLVVKTMFNFMVVFPIHVLNCLQQGLPKAYFTPPITKMASDSIFSIELYYQGFTETKTQEKSLTKD